MVISMALTALIDLAVCVPEANCAVSLLFLGVHASGGAGELAHDCAFTIGYMAYHTDVDRSLFVDGERLRSVGLVVGFVLLCLSG